MNDLIIFFGLNVINSYILSDVDGIIRLNMGFSNKRTKVRVALGSNASSGSRNQTEAERTAASVDEDRKMFLQAAIVRIMKARKVISIFFLILRIVC